MNKVYRIRGTAGGDRINYDGPTKANTAALSTVKLLLQSIVSDNANFMTLLGHQGFLPHDASTAFRIHPHSFEIPLRPDSRQAQSSSLHFHQFNIIRSYQKYVRFTTRGKDRTRQPHRASGYSWLPADRHYLPLPSSQQWCDFHSCCR
jgi:hypothetical protein